MGSLVNCLRKLQSAGLVDADLANKVRERAKGGDALAAVDALTMEIIGELEQVRLAVGAPMPVAAGKLEDFGEKIGGARKDTAQATGPRGSKVESDEEAGDDDVAGWRKRYEVGQITGQKRMNRATRQMEDDTTENGKWEIRDKRTKGYDGMPRRVGRRLFDSQAEAEQAVPLVEVARMHTTYPTHRSGETPRWAVVRKVTDRKRKVIKDGFATEEEAKAYMAQNAVEIIEAKTAFGEEILVRPDARQVRRVGPERRTGPATPQSFMDTFGFRGVEFGNWNNQEERQEVMDNAFDALLDLAQVLGVPPKALSLDGVMGLAFGARGHGLTGARAHYEPDKAVINLTKMKGAGALAHEWWHAVDHYFARQDGIGSQQMVDDPAGGRTFAKTELLSATSRRDGGMRAELRDAFRRVMDTINYRSEQFVKDTELAERFVSEARKELSDQLDQARRTMASDRTYGAKKKAATTEQLARWDGVVDAILNGDPVPLGSKFIEGRTRAGGRMVNTNEQVDALEQIHKEVTGRGGRTAERTGTLDRVVAQLSYYHKRAEMVRDARDNPDGTRKIPTEYRQDARKIDEGRRGDYWTLPEELSARAFSAFTEDALEKSGQASGFLSFGSDNKYYRIFEIRPFPEGAEREAINAAFRSFLDAIKTETTDRGTVRMFDLSGTNDQALIIDTAAASKQMAPWGRIERTPAGPVFIAKNGVQVDLVAPSDRYLAETMERENEARRAAGKPLLEKAPNGWFEVDRVTGRPKVYLVPGRSGHWTLNHELIHAALRAGVITRQERAALLRLARKHGIYDEVRARGYDRNVLVDESVAHVVESILDGRIKAAGKPGVIRRLLDWLRRLGEAVGIGRRSDEQVGREIAEGRQWGRDAIVGGGEPSGRMSYGDLAKTVSQEQVSSAASRITGTTTVSLDEVGTLPGSVTLPGGVTAAFDSGARNEYNRGARIKRVLLANAQELLDRSAVIALGAPDQSRREGITFDYYLARVDSGRGERLNIITVRDYYGTKYIHDIAAVNAEPQPKLTGTVEETGRGMDRGSDDATIPDNDGEGKAFSLAPQDDDAPDLTPAERKAKAYGAPPSEKAKQNRAELLASFRRHFLYLDPKAQAENIRILREFEAERDSAGSRAERIIRGFVDGLTKEQARIFADILATQDIARQIEEGEFTGVDKKGRAVEQLLAEAQSDLEKAKQAGGEAVAAAVAKRQAFIREHTRKLVEAGLLDEKALADDRYYHRQVLAHMGSPFAGLIGSDQVTASKRGFQRERAGGTADQVPFYGTDQGRDFNTNYAQAEYEVIAQGEQELAKVRAMGRLRALNDRLPEAKAEAKARNRKAMDEWFQRTTEEQMGEVEEGELEEALALGWDSQWRTAIAIRNDALAKLAADTDGRWGTPFDHVWEALAGAYQNWHQQNMDREPADREAFTFDHPEWFQALGWIVAHRTQVPAVRVDQRGNGTPYLGEPSLDAAGIFKAIAEREKFTRETLTKEKAEGRGPGYLTWNDVAKELDGYVEWQPEKGLQIGQGYVATAQTVREALVEQGIDPEQFSAEAPDVLPIGEGEARRGRVVYGRKPVWLIPQELAAQFDRMAAKEAPQKLRDYAEKATREWKKWILSNPFGVIRYNLNNFFGDIDVAMTDPAVLREVGKDKARLVRDLWNWTHGKKVDPITSALLEQAERIGLLDSGTMVAELADVDRIPGLEQLFGRDPETAWQKAKAMAGRYWTSAQAFSRWREGILRVASARRFYRQISHIHRRYAASRRDEMDQLYDRWAVLERQKRSLEDGISRRVYASNPESARETKQIDDLEAEIRNLRAGISAKLAREMMGDYGAISEAGEWMRRGLIPFWSWSEINLPRYVRLLRNARHEGTGGAGQAIGASLAMGAGMGLRMGLMTGLVWGWNSMMKGALGINDQDDPNKDQGLGKLRIILWKNGDGTAGGIQVAGAMADALGWFDLDDAWPKAQEVREGMREGKGGKALLDVAADLGMAPVNRLVNSVNPIAKEAAAQALGRDPWPDVRSPRPLGERLEHLAGMFGAPVRDALRAARDKTGAGDVGLRSLGLQTWDPARQSEMRVRDRIERWASRNGKAVREGGGDPTDRSVALREARQALARGNEARAARWLVRYYEAGGKPSSLAQSKRMLHPLAMLRIEDRKPFSASLDAGGREDLDRAVKSWEAFWSKDGDGFSTLAGRAWKERRK